MRSLTVTLIVLAVLGAAGAAAAAEQSTGRFTMTPSDGGFIRMDTQTGVLSFCAKKSGTLACAIVPDDKLALQRDMDKLKSENKELKEENSRLEEMLLGDKQTGKPAGKFRLPTEKDVDKALKYVEDMYKKFRDKLRDLEKQQGGSAPTPL